MKGLVKSVDVIQGDCFGEDFERLPKEASFLLASNIVNYTENPQSFIEQCINKLGQNGFGIFIHPEEGSSFLHLLQEYKNEPIVKTGANEVAKAFERLKIKNYLLSYCCAIHFPAMTNEIWDKLAANETETQKDVVIAKNLLEFFLKTSLDTLHEKQLQNYLKDMRALMTADNKILVPMVFQIYLPKPTLEFEKTFSSVMKSIQQTLSLEKVNLNNRFFSRQGKEEVVTVHGSCHP